MRQRVMRVLGAIALGAVVVLEALAPGSSPPRAAAEPGALGYRAASPEYGLSVFLYGNTATTTRDLDQLRGLNFGWQKSLFRWRDLEGACKGCFTWDEADRVVRASAEAGLKIIARLDFQPTWARRDGAHNGAPDRYADFADFVSAFVSRYRAGSPYGTVQAIEVWNEVNLQREWGSPISPQSAADYVRLLELAYRAAKAADPSVTVITAGLSPTGWSDDTARPDDEFLQWLYAAGLKAGRNYDVLGANGNVQCPSVEAAPGACPVLAERMQHGSFYFRRIEQLRAIMEAQGDAAAQVWLMEFGWTTDPVNPAYAWYATTDQTKAGLIVQAFQFAAQRWAPWIGVMTLWTLADPAWKPSDEQVYWAITNPDGSPRPAYDRLRAAVQTGELPHLGQLGATAVSAPAAAPAPQNPVPAPEPAGASAGTLFRIVGTAGTGLLLRAEPGLEAVVLKSLPEGAQVEAIGDDQERDGVLWRNVRDAAGAEGWISTRYVEPI